MSQSPDHDQEWRPPADGAPGGGSDPYGGEPAVPYGPYGTAYAPAPPATGGPSAPPSTIVLLVVSGVLLLATSWTIVGIAWAAPVVLAAVGLSRNATNPSSTRRLTRIGWWVTAGLGVAGLLLVALLVVGIVIFGRTATSTGYDSSTVGLSAALTAVHALTVVAAR